jgi:aminopeptidase N
LATYLSNVALEAVASPEMAESERRSWARVYDWAKGNYPSLGPTSPVYAFPDSAVYSSYVYSGAALEFYALRARIGGHAFDQALGEYVSSHRFGMASPNDLAAAFSDACSCRPDGALFTAAEN